MFGFKSKQNDEEEKGERELQYWIATADDFSLSPSEFYDAVEHALNQLQVPGLTVERDEMAEGGMLSDQCTYLRLMREHIIFYICAAQFGSRYFFSSRIVYLKPTLKLTHVLVILILLFAVFRKETYYRKDTRNMYLDTIPAVVQALADEVTGKQGVKPIRQYRSAPIRDPMNKERRFLPLRIDDDLPEGLLSGFLFRQWN